MYSKIAALASARVSSATGVPVLFSMKQKSFPLAHYPGTRPTPHRLSETHFSDQFAVFCASVLVAPIGVMGQSRNWPPATQSHSECVTTQLSTHVILHRPTNNLSCGHILHTGKIKPAFIYIDMRDVGQPNGVWDHKVKLLLQKVWGWAHLVIAICRDWLSALFQAW